MQYPGSFTVCSYDRRSSVRCRTPEALPGFAFAQSILRYSANFSSSAALGMVMVCERRGGIDGCSRAGRGPFIGRWIHSATRNPAHPAIHSPPGEANPERIRDRSDKPSAVMVLLRRSRRLAARQTWRLRDWVSFPNHLFRCTVMANAPYPSQRTFSARADLLWLETADICCACESLQPETWQAGNGQRRSVSRHYWLSAASAGPAQ